MWFRRFLDPVVRTAPAIGVIAMVAMPMMGNFPKELQQLSNIALVVLASAGVTILLARFVWMINKATLTDGGPRLSNIADLNRLPIESMWLGLRGFDLYVTIPLFGLILEFILFFGGDSPDDVKNWLGCNVFFLMAVGHYTRKARLFARTSDPETTDI